MATFTATKAKAGVQPQGVHVGSNVVISTFMWGVTNSDDATTSATAAADDVIRMAKLPNGATIHRVALIGNRDDGAYTFGTSADADAFATQFSAAAGVKTECTIGLPYTVSISDDASVAYEWLTATVLSAGFTLSDQLQVIVEYTMA